MWPLFARRLPVTAMSTSSSTGRFAMTSSRRSATQLVRQLRERRRELAPGVFDAAFVDVPLVDPRGLELGEPRLRCRILLAQVVEAVAIVDLRPGARGVGVRHQLVQPR